MSDRNWLEILGWGHGEIDDLRIVAYSYLKQGLYDIALTFFNALAVLAPPTFYDLQTVGAIHLQMGNGSPSVRLFRSCIKKLDPTHLPTQMNRAKAFFYAWLQKTRACNRHRTGKKMKTKTLQARLLPSILAYQ